METYFAIFIYPASVVYWWENGDPIVLKQDMKYWLILFLNSLFTPECSRFQKLLPILCSPTNLHYWEGLDPLWALINDNYTFKMFAWSAPGLVFISSSKKWVRNSKISAENFEPKAPKGTIPWRGSSQRLRQLVPTWHIFPFPIAHSPLQVRTCHLGLDQVNLLIPRIVLRGKIIMISYWPNLNGFR